MTARNIIRALDGRWHGSYGMALCPSHDDGKEPALKVADDPKRPGEVLVHCFAGCNWRDVKDALRGRGLLQPRQGDDRIHDGNRHAMDQRQSAALKIWRDSLPATNTVVETYLRARGLTLGQHLLHIAEARSEPGVFSTQGQVFVRILLSVASHSSL